MLSCRCLTIWYTMPKRAVIQAVLRSLRKIIDPPSVPLKDEYLNAIENEGMLSWCHNGYGLVDIEPDERIQMDDQQSLEQWASSHETDIRIVGAICQLAGG